MLDFDRYRGLFPVTQQCIFLEHAAIAPVSTRVVAAMNEYLADVATSGGRQEPAWNVRVEKARAGAAALCGATPEEIAFVKNTSEGLLHVANGIRWREGDNVVIPAIEFPANVYPWTNLSRRGVETRLVPARDRRVLVDDLVAAMDERTRVISVSFVQYAHGFRADLDALGAACRERGVLFCVDAIQGLGALQLDVRRTPVDFFSADGHKWLLAPEGIGVFYLRKDRLEDLVPHGAGWCSVERAETGTGDYSQHSAPLLDSAARFEPGTRNNVGIYGLGAALDLLREVGLETIEARVLGLTDRLIEGLQRKGYTVLSSLVPCERSAIVSFVSDRFPTEDLWRRARAENILISLREGALRVAPHFYNTDAEIDALLDVLPPHAKLGSSAFNRGVVIPRDLMNVDHRTRSSLRAGSPGFSRANSTQCGSNQLKLRLPTLPRDVDPKTPRLNVELPKIAGEGKMGEWGKGRRSRLRTSPIGIELRSRSGW